MRIPSLIIQGTTDIQVKVEDAYQLASSSKEDNLKIIEGMNHILKNTALELKENIRSYNQPNLPINQELTKEIVEFVKL